MSGRSEALVVATTNPGKLREIAALVAGSGVSVRPLPAGGRVDFPEEGFDYEANARAKALAVSRALGVAAVADDSGLEVDALGGAPGPRSARFGGPGLDDAGRVRALLEALAAYRERAERRARFVCLAALAFPDGECVTARGVCEGVLRGAPVGAGGFGYDPIFEPLDPRAAGRTMAELDPLHKQALSHRARAFEALRQTPSWSSRVAT